VILYKVKNGYGSFVMPGLISMEFFIEGKSIFETPLINKAFRYIEALGYQYGDGPFTVAEEIKQ
jgi:hypothetical protein